MSKDKIKRINKKKTTLFICSFLGISIFITLLNKTIGFRGAADSWEEIVRYSPLLMLFSLGFAVWLTWGGLGDELIEFFAMQCRKRRKNEKKRQYLGKN